MERRRFLISALAVSMGTGVAGLTTTRARAEETPDQRGDSELPAGAVAFALDRWTVATRTASAPQIDGRLDDEIWADAATLSGFVTPYYLDAIDGDASVKLAFDDAALYLGISYTDSDDAASLVGIEVVIGNAAGDYFRVPIQVRTVEPRFGNELGPDLTVVEEAESVSTTADGAVITEVAVPFAALAGRMSDGDEWRINVILQHEMMSRPLSSWTPIRTTTNHHNGFGSSERVQLEVTNQDRLGSMFLGALPAGDRPEPPEPFDPQNARLSYASFTEKVISFDRNGIGPNDVVRLEWKAPGEKWAAVQNPRPERDGRQLTIRFGHSGPVRKGLYQLKIIIERGDKREPDGLAVITFDRLALIRAGDSTVELPGRGNPTKIKHAPASAEVEQLIGWISDRNGFIFVGIPDKPELRPSNLYTFDPEDPDVLQSRYTDQRYPNHPDYPEDQVLTVTNRLGEVQEYPYHEDPDGNRFFLTSHLWFRRREYVLRRLPDLAKEDPLGAARVINHFAQVYPGWVPTNDYPGYNRPVDPASVPVNYYWGGTWSRWSASELYTFRYLMDAYGSIAKTNAFDVLGDDLGEDVVTKINQEMLEPTVEFYRSYVILYHNMDATNAQGLISMGKALGDPSYIHETVEWAREYGRITYLFDGYYKENTLSYHNQATNGLTRVIDGLAGWTDPEGYASPRSGERFTDFDLGVEVPVLGNAGQLGHRLIYPDDKLFPMEDTWASATSDEPQQDAGSFQMPAGGVARLVRGQAGDAIDNPAQAYLMYPPKYGHHHFDPLNIAVFAEGQELLPDIGYTHTFYRQLTRSAMAHNTVVVDSSDMRTDGAGADGGNLEIFEHTDDVVQVMRAAHPGAYPQTSDYSREVWQIGFDGAAGNEGYLLDLFRVTGGDRHEYVLHGDANRDATLTTDAELADYGPYLLPEGVQVTEPTTELEQGDAEGHYYGYIYVRQVQRAELGDGSFDLTLATTGDEGQELAGARILGLTGEGATELFLGKSPSLRATRVEGKSQDTNEEAVKYLLPTAVLRKGGNDLHSQFVTMIEPVGAGKTSRVESIERVVPDQAADGSIAVKINYGDVSDLVLSSADPDSPMVVGDASLTGKLGLIRMAGGTVTKLVLIGGTALSSGGTEITDDGPVTGLITGVLRRADGDGTDALITDVAVPDSMIGKTLVITHPDGKTHGYPIKAISGQQVEIDGIDPGFTVNDDGSTELQFLPFTRWTGDTTFRIENQASS